MKTWQFWTLITVVLVLGAGGLTLLALPLLPEQESFERIDPRLGDPN